MFVHYFRTEPSGGEAEPTTRDVPGEPLYRAQQAHTADALVPGDPSAGGRADALETDLADAASIPALFDRAEAAFGRSRSW